MCPRAAPLFDSAGLMATAGEFALPEKLENKSSAISLLS